MNASTNQEKNLREKLGVTKSPIQATRVLVRDLDPGHFQNVDDAKAIIAINDNDGTYVAANVYDGRLGKKYDPQHYRHPLPPEKDPKWKTWKRKKYVEGNVEDFDVLELVSVKS